MKGTKVVYLIGCIASCLHRIQRGRCIVGQRLDLGEGGQLIPITHVELADESREIRY